MAPIGGYESNSRKKAHSSIVWGELWGDNGKYFADNWSCYKGTALYWGLFVAWQALVFDIVKPQANYELKKQQQEMVNS